MIKHLSLFLAVFLLSLFPHTVFQEKRGMMNAAGHQLLLTCLETLQRALKGETVKSQKGEGEKGNTF